MSFHRRIRTIYGKEMTDILRDRRTLIAMILVPIVLYPLLMLGSIQAVSYQAESMGEERLIIGVVGERQAAMLQQLIEGDAYALRREADQLDPESEEAKELPAPLDHFQLHAFQSQEHLEEAVRNRAIQLGVVFADEALSDEIDRTNHIELLPDYEDVRSAFALGQLHEMFNRIDDRTVGQRKQRFDLPAAFDKPFELTVTDLSTPSSILGQILPLILILMTITGAIYPAIDLTAGERERGTLESLMVCPVPVIDLIVGKFLVVTTVAIMGAALNLASVTATVYFGGFDKVIASTGGGIPLAKMVFILLCLIPFAVLMSAIMIAVCSFARTFKEAQNYVTPVILAVLIPGGIAALPATRLEGIMLVMPVGNMVLLAREFLLGATIPAWNIVMVLLSTTMYAGAAVAVATNVFGKESVVFADAGSLKSVLSRVLIKPADRPTLSMGLLVVAVLFPTWFFVQSALSPGPDEDASGLLFATGWLMPVLFVILPVGILAYWKVDIQNTLCIRMPAPRHLAAAVLIGLSAWVPAYELNVLQQSVLGAPQAVVESAEMLQETLAALPVGSVFVLIALVPAVCEELLFRGFLLSSLGTSSRKWTAILVSAAVFGVFHFFLFKFAVTVVLGVVLGYLCWQSRSILPAVIAHFLHNAIGAYSAVNPGWHQWIGISEDTEWAH
ncbi:MAG: ABC transporter permease subunit/CPBP intramembrane protease, partial [Phycisphaerae bacterium]